MSAMLGASSSKRYGRGGSAVDNVFRQQPTADPFLFDSDEEQSVVESKSKSAGSKRKVRPNQVKTDGAALNQNGHAKAGRSKSSKSVKQPNHWSVSGEQTASQRQNIGTSRSSSNYSSMQITSTTVYQSDPMDGDAGASDFENTEPTMTISSETVHEYNGCSDSVGVQTTDKVIAQHKPNANTRPTRSLRYSTRSSSVSSVESANVSPVRPVESDRLKDFLRSGNEFKTSPKKQHGLTTALTSRPVESDRLKRFLAGTSEPKCRSPSVSSVDSFVEDEPARQRLPNFLQSSDSSGDEASLRVGASRSAESERLKLFLQSEPATKGKSDDTTKGNKKKGRQKLTTKSERSTTRKTNKASGSDSSKLVESERLKKFLGTDTAEDGASSGDDSLDKTLVPTQLVESKRLQEFLGTSSECNDVDALSTSSKSSSTSTVSIHAPRESDRLRAFLKGEDKSEPGTTKLTRIKPAGKRSKKSSESAGNHTGLSQEFCDVSLGEGSNDPSPPKRRLINDEFSFESDGEDNLKHELPSNKQSNVASKGSSTQSKSVGNKISAGSTQNVSKPVINFEKMEGRTEKGSSRPLRKLLGNQGKSQTKYRYNHRVWLDDSKDSDESAIVPTSSSRHDKAKCLKRPLTMRKVPKYPDKLGEKISTRVMVPQDQKSLYTVVRNVRQAHECQDHGENQQIDDDLLFLLQGLEPHEPMSSRYLSAVSLANKCTNAAFRMHLRSHSSLSEIFTSLSDAPSDPRLALSATAIMFMLCQDRLNMDLDRASLKLMVHLLEYDDRALLERKQDIDDYEKSVDTVYGLYKSAIPAGEELLEKCDLSPGYLAMECLLVLTSRRSGDWFKEELREAGAIICLADSIIDKTSKVMSADYDMELSAHTLVFIKKICRGLRVLEHVTANNTGNQSLIVQHQGGEFVTSLCRLLMFGVEAIPTHSIDSSSLPSSAGHLLLLQMLGVLRVLVNVTHDYKTGCTTVHSFNGVVEVLLKCILQSCQYVLEEQRFDLLVLGIGLSINLCEHSADCRQTLLHTETLSSYDSICEQDTVLAAEALLLLFHQRLRAAEKIEAETGNLDSSDISNAVGEDEQESLTEVLHKAGRHMEDTIVASYIALLIGVIVQHSPDYIDQVKKYLKDNSFNDIISVLQKFLNFMKMADAASGNTGSKSINTVIAYLKECT